MNTLLLYFAKFVQKMHIPAIRSSNIHKTSRIGSYCNIIDSKIDRYSYVGNNCVLVSTSVGSFCSIASNCIIGGGSHPKNWVSTSPIFYKGNNILKTNFSEHIYNDMKYTSIGNDVWLGNSVIVKAGVKIGNGSIVGMGSVLTKDVPSYEIWAGNPAKKIGKRFSNEIAEKLEKTDWFELDEKILKELSEYTNDPEKFIERLSKSGIL